MYISDAIICAAELAKICRIGVCIVKTKADTVEYNDNYYYIVNTQFDRFKNHSSGCYSKFIKVGIIDKKGIYHASKVKSKPRSN